MDDHIEHAGKDPATVVRTAASAPDPLEALSST